MDEDFAMMDNFKQVQKPKEEAKVGGAKPVGFGDKKDEDNGLIVDNDFGDDFDEDEEEED